MAKLQWVNLTKDKVFVEDEVPSKEYLEHVHFQCKFSKAKPAAFKVRVVEKGKPATYTAKEKARNPHFKQRHTRSQVNHGKDSVKAEEKVYLPAAGGNEYEIEALYKRKVVKGKHTRETRRKIYYQAISMVGVTAPGLGPTESYYEKLFVVLKNKGGPGQMPFVNNVDANDANECSALVKLAKASYTIDKYKPWAFAAVFVNMIGMPGRKDFTVAQSPLLSAPSKLVSIVSSTITYTLPQKTYLWYGLSALHDAANGGKGYWWVPGSCKWTDAAGVVHNIPDANVSIDMSKRKTALGGYNTLKIEIPSHLKSLLTSSKGRIAISVYVVQGFCGGYSENSVNFITVAKSGWWDEFTDAKRLQILNHEMGHKLGMVQDGKGRSLDPPATLYGNIRGGPKANNKGHQGPHCEKGASYAGGSWVGTPGCVMFGATSCHDAAGNVVLSPSTYCGECEKIVRKLDLDGRMMRGFRTSITTY